MGEELVVARQVGYCRQLVSVFEGMCRGSRSHLVGGRLDLSGESETHYGDGSRRTSVQHYKCVDCARRRPVYDAPISSSRTGVVQ